MNCFANKFSPLLKSHNGMNNKYSISSQFCVEYTCFRYPSPGFASPSAAVQREIFLRIWIGFEQLLQTMENRALEDKNDEHETPSWYIQDAKDKGKQGNADIERHNFKAPENAHNKEQFCKNWNIFSQFVWFDTFPVINGENMYGRFNKENTYFIAFLVLKM